MTCLSEPTSPTILADFMALAGMRVWEERAAYLHSLGAPHSLAGRAALQHHALEWAVLRLREQSAPPNLAQRHLLALVTEALRLDQALNAAGRDRFRAMITDGLQGDGTLVHLFHVLRVAMRHRAHGYVVNFVGLEDGAEADLRISEGNTVASLACETVSAEEGRPLNRSDWFTLVDRVNPDLQRWLSAHPGRYLLKMTLPEGLGEPSRIPDLHRKIMTMLDGQRRSDPGRDAFLRLDPLIVAGARNSHVTDQGNASNAALPLQLRQQFGPEAQLAVTACPAGASVCVMAAQAGQVNAIAGVVVRRMASAVARLENGQPGIVSIFLDDLEREEWRRLRDTLELEGAARRFLAGPAARPVVAASCASRMEMLGMVDAAPDGEVRFRNPSHPAARDPGLQKAVMSSM